MRNTANSLTQPTECSNKTLFPSALIAPPRVGPAKSRLCTQDHLVTSTTAKQPKRFAGISEQKFYQFIKKEETVFSSWLLFWLLQNFPELHMATFTLSSAIPHPALSTDCQSQESFPGCLSNPIRPLHFPSSDAQLLAGFFILYLHMAFTRLT